MQGVTVQNDGCALVSNVLDEAQCQMAIAALGPVKGAGRRGLLAEPWAAELATSQTLLRIVRPHLQQEPAAVRAIYFDKSANANWLVPWHQDLTLALAAKAEHADYGPWSVKAGVTHAQAPAAALEKMITIRLHLDDTGVDDGPLRVLAGSHKHGVLSAEQIVKLRQAGEANEVVCTAGRGDVMLMRPLLLHASGKSTSERHRRILHIEYAGFDLPAPLAWHESAAGA